MKAKVNFKCCNVTSWKTNNCPTLPNTTILSNISRIRRNQTVKVDQLTEYNVRNIFIQELCRDRETSSRPF